MDENACTVLQPWALKGYFGQHRNVNTVTILMLLHCLTLPEQNWNTESACPAIAWFFWTFIQYFRTLKMPVWRKVFFWKVTPQDCHFLENHSYTRSLSILFLYLDWGIITVLAVFHNIFQAFCMSYDGNKNFRAFMSILNEMSHGNGCVQTLHVVWHCNDTDYVP